MRNLKTRYCRFAMRWSTIADHRGDAARTIATSDRYLESTSKRTWQGKAEFEVTVSALRSDSEREAAYQSTSLMDLHLYDQPAGTYDCCQPRQRSASREWSTINKCKRRWLSRCRRSIDITSAQTLLIKQDRASPLSAYLG